MHAGAGARTQVAEVYHLDGKYSRRTADPAQRLDRGLIRCPLGASPSALQIWEFAWPRVDNRRRGVRLPTESAWDWPRYSRAESGDIAVVMEDAESPLDVWIGRPGDSAIEWTQFTDLHPQSTDFHIGSS